MRYRRHDPLFDDLEWAVRTAVQISVGIVVGVGLGVTYLVQALTGPQAARARRMDDGPSDLHQARHKARVETRINPPVGPSRPPKKKKVPKPRKGRTRMIGGIVLMFMGVGVTEWTLLLIGAALAAWGFFVNRDMRRFSNHLKRIGGRDTISREELASIVGCTDAQAERDLRKMAASGYLGEDAYYNDEFERMFRSLDVEEAWKAKEQERREQERREAAAAAPPPPETEEGYTGILRSIRRANDRISDPVLSAKISQLEDITARIFKAVEDDPSKRRQIDRLLDYYLPTTQKLLDSYAEFEAAGVEGENLSQAKARISSTMDMVLQGFSRQLDELYRGDALDIDSDIRVMEAMLRRDTGSASDDFDLGGIASQMGGE